VAAAAYLLDRLTKLWAEGPLRDRGRPLELIPNVLQLSYTTNSGGAFGLGQRQPWLFFIASVVVCAAIAWASFRLASTVSAVGLGLVLGGGLGNLTDRLIRGAGISGRVVDFIDFHVWPVFNLADSAIVIGAVVIAAAGIRRRT
jgi:signal peptidase II